MISQSQGKLPLLMFSASFTCFPCTQSWILMLLGDSCSTIEECFDDTLSGAASGCHKTSCLLQSGCASASSQVPRLKPLNPDSNSLTIRVPCRQYHGLQLGLHGSSCPSGLAPAPETDPWAASGFRCCKDCLCRIVGSKWQSQWTVGLVRGSTS